MSRRSARPGKSITARHLRKYFGLEGISTHTHVSDQHSTFGTKVTVATHREAHKRAGGVPGHPVAPLRRVWAAPLSRGTAAPTA
ncbi:hypothetical protein GCM10010377_68340 [Streptomyces viridiviolaceus]|uniref:Tn3 family transposase n=1 Tax=Streptomyces viridiviolaceus TaxID=68282 RepID=A0ABW2EBJ9_9ACTN|nr:hypothetical protein GCM10010377_68340 [Streptomyces viridiviolaceus]